MLFLSSLVGVVDEALRSEIYEIEFWSRDNVTSSNMNPRRGEWYCCRTIIPYDRRM